MEYRVYRLSSAGRIVSGEWVSAADDEAAKVKAAEFCDAATPTIELWQGARRVAVLPCEADEAAA